MTLQRPQSSPSYLAKRKPVKDLGNFVPAAQLFAEARGNPRRPNTPTDPNKAPPRPSGSPRSRRLQPKRDVSPGKGNMQGVRSGATSRAETVQMGPGLFMTKSHDKISVTLRTEFSECDTPPVRKTPVENLKDRIRELEEQLELLQGGVDDLTVELEEERFSHRMTKQSAIEELNYQLQQLKGNQVVLIIGFNGKSIE